VDICDGDPGGNPDQSPLTLCRSWLRDDNVAEIRCWSESGNVIQICGHGLLCTGVAWHLSGTPVTALVMNGLCGDFQRSGDNAWAALPVLPTAPCCRPDWLARFFPSAPIRCAQAGGSDGYLILEWPPGTELPAFSAPGPELGEHTRRALIATCMDPQQEDVDIRFRYFAPQYGNAEDTATGSAMRVLADYWQERRGKVLTAWQNSPAGGLLYSRRERDRCWIGGRVQLESSL